MVLAAPVWRSINFDDELLELLLSCCRVEDLIQTSVLPLVHSFVLHSSSELPTSTVEYWVCALACRRLYTCAANMVFLQQGAALSLQSFSAAQVVLHRFLKQVLGATVFPDKYFAIAKHALRIFENDCLAVPAVSLISVFVAMKV